MFRTSTNVNNDISLSPQNFNETDGKMSFSHRKFTIFTIDERTSAKIFTVIFPQKVHTKFSSDYFTSLFLQKINVPTLCAVSHGKIHGNVLQSNATTKLYFKRTINITSGNYHLLDGLIRWMVQVLLV